MLLQLIYLDFFGRNEEAIEDFTKAIDNNPQDT